MDDNKVKGVAEPSPAEREAIAVFGNKSWTAVNWSVVEKHAATLRGLLERTK